MSAGTLFCTIPPEVFSSEAGQCTKLMNDSYKTSTIKPIQQKPYICPRAEMGVEWDSRLFFGGREDDVAVEDAALFAAL